MIETVRTARSFGIATTLIHHLGKDQKDKSKPYGTVYASHEARLTWLYEAEHEAGTDALTLVCSNKKFNRGPKRRPKAYRISFSNADDLLVAVEFREMDETETWPGFEDRRGRSVVIAELINANGGQVSVADLVTLLEGEHINMSQAALRGFFSRHADRFVRLRAKNNERDRSSVWGNTAVQREAIER